MCKEETVKVNLVSTKIDKSKSPVDIATYSNKWFQLVLVIRYLDIARTKMGDYRRQLNSRIDIHN